MALEPGEGLLDAALAAVTAPPPPHVVECELELVPTVLDGHVPLTRDHHRRVVETESLGMSPRLIRTLPARLTTEPAGSARTLAGDERSPTPCAPRARFHHVTILVEPAPDPVDGRQQGAAGSATG